jgi:signal transduction histidine kinase
MPKLPRIAPLIALLAAIAVLVAGLLMIAYEERAYAVQKTDEATVQARILASTVAAAVFFGDREAAQEYVEATRANPEAQAVAIYDAQGRLFVGYSRDGAEPLSVSLDTARPTRDAGALRVLTQITQADTFLGTVYLQAGIEPISRRLQRYGAVGMLVGMAALVFLVLGLTQRTLARQAASLAAANEELRKQILQREQVEAALRQAQKMEAIGQLTGGVAHDFNNILHVIIGNVESMQRRIAGNDIRRSDAAFVRLTEAALRAAERAATLTSQLLAFSRRQPLAPKALEVNRLVAGMSDLLRRTLGETIGIETVLAGGLWRISADPNQLESALLNLAVNARDAMPGGGKLTIETANAHIDETYARSEQDVSAGQYVMIAVTDAGTGMSKDVMAQAFDPFFTTKEVGRGTGLGLSQVYGFVKQSGGHVRIYSEPGEGTSVKLYLPRLASEPTSEEEARAAQPAPGGEELILVVEDSEDVRANTVSMLRELGYGVIEAADGTEALRQLQAQPRIRLLFTDVGLPGMNGRELADEARRRRPELSVLFTTGYARNAIVHNGKLDPGVELIAKPFSFPVLAAKLREVLERVPS